MRRLWWLQGPKHMVPGRRDYRRSGRSSRARLGLAFALALCTVAAVSGAGELVERVVKNADELASAIADRVDFIQITDHIDLSQLTTGDGVLTLPTLDDDTNKWMAIWVRVELWKDCCSVCNTGPLFGAERDAILLCVGTLDPKIRYGK